MCVFILLYVSSCYYTCPQDAFALLEKARAAQREEVQRHAGALDEQVCCLRC